MTGSSENTRRAPRLIQDNDTLHNQFNDLGAGDIFIGRIRLRPGEESLVVDLMARGVKLFPSGLAQLSCRSKVFQAKIFAEYMAPHTRTIHDLNQLIEAINHYQQKGIKQVVTKKDRANAGMGINLWQSGEDVFNQASCGGLHFPFVLQPFYLDCRDIRVIIIDDYIEAYQRDNPDNFRNNLHFGGEGAPAKLTGTQLQLCQKVMKRGDYPYAHLDLMVTPEGECYLAEINLRGGIRGAAISPQEYRQRIEGVHLGYRIKKGL